MSRKDPNKEFLGGLKEYLDHLTKEGKRKYMQKMELKARESNFEYRNPYGYVRNSQDEVRKIIKIFMTGEESTPCDPWSYCNTNNVKGRKEFRTKLLSQLKFLLGYEPVLIHIGCGFYHIKQKRMWPNQE